MLIVVGLAGACAAQDTAAKPKAEASIAASADEVSQLASMLEEPQEAGGTSASATTNDSGVVGIVPVQKGFNASLVTTSQHDSSSGWQSILTPNVAYRFNRYFSVNSGTAVYTYLLVSKQVGRVTVAKPDPVYASTPEHWLLGDTTLAGSVEAHTQWLDYNLDGTLGLPTGDNADGLGAGQVTYNFNNHFERSVTDWFTPDMELGIGDSPNLDDSRVRKSFTTVGTNAHFQAGASFSLPKGISFSTEAYEDLPLGTQTVTSTTINAKARRGQRVVKSSTEKSIGEDNGFLQSLDIPLNGHITLSGNYNRSLRNKTDTAGFALTFLLRHRPKES